MQLVRFSYYKNANRIASCSAVRFDYAILWAVLVRFGEHLYIYIYIEGAVRFVQFSYYKIANRIASCGAVHCYLWCDAIIPFCGRFLRFGEHF